MGADDTNLPAVPGDGLPAGPSEMEGWSAEDLVTWLERAAPTAARYRLAIGLALWKLRTVLAEGDYGRHVTEIATAAGVNAGTLGRWRAAAEVHWRLDPPPKAAKRTKARRGRLTAKSRESKAVEATATELIGPTPHGAMPLPRGETGSTEHPPERTQAVTAEWLTIIAKTSVEDLRALGHVLVRDAADRLAAADRRKLVTLAELSDQADELRRLREAAQAPPKAPRLPKVTPVASSPAKRAAAKESGCIHPISRRIGDSCAVCGEKVRGK